MKNIFKAFGIIAIVAVIGFSMAACSSGDDGVTPNPDDGKTKPNPDDGSSIAVLDHITAVYIGVEAIFPDTTLHTLKDDLTVKAHYSDNTETTLEMEDYELSGTLTVGSSIITVSYQSKTTTFTVTVHAPHSHNWGNWETITQATCSEEGEEGRHCTADPPHSETRPLPIDLINGHNYQWQATTPATFTSEGVETEICTHNSTHTRNTRPIPQIPFTSIAAMNTWLASQSANNAATAYPIKLNVGNLGGDINSSGSAGKALTDNSTKYVSLDFSGSTFTSIGDNAFNNCTSLASVTIGSGVTSIGYQAFVNCTSITSITIPNSVTTIGYRAFNSCTSLASVTIGNSVTVIDEAAFAWCTSLTSVTIPNSVTTIKDAAFYGCTSLTSVTFQGTNTWISNDNPFPGDLRDKYIASPGGGIGTYTRPNTTSTTWTKR